MCSAPARPVHPAPEPVPAGPVPLAARMRAVRGSAIRDLLTLTARHDVLSLAGGLPAVDLMPHERIAAATARALAAPAAVQYSETAGIGALREAVAAHESARTGRDLGPADVVVTSGSQQALDLLARATLDPGAAVVVEDPAYVGALQVFQAAGAVLHGVPVDADGMDLDALERLLDGVCGHAWCTPSRASTTRAGSPCPSSDGPASRGWPTGTASSSSRTTRTD
ncbi:aminotransferase class I/II-fold pyridoxal phosphate-dependent enzyme [Pseudonocardia benzenivorans]